MTMIRSLRPDAVEANHEASKDFLYKVKELKVTMNDAEWDQFLFSAGFNQGVCWMYDVAKGAFEDMKAEIAEIPTE